jgi:hypothetical protein
MLDHLVYAIQDLNEGVDRIEQLTGVRPAPGGRHVGRGTWNALLSFGGDQYLEVIAPDPEQANLASGRGFGLDRPGPARLVTWAAKAPGIEERVRRARAAGFDPGEPVAMSRDLPDGSRLEWKLTRREQAAGDGLIPFLIDWGSSVHPSTTAPGGVRLIRVRAEHPDPEAITRMLAALELEIDVTRGEKPALIAALHGPAGDVELS